MGPDVKESSQQLSRSSIYGSRMAAEPHKPTLADVVTGDENKSILDTESSVKKQASRRRQYKSSKNRNKKKAKKQEEEQRKSMEELAASVNAREGKFGATNLIDPSRESFQGCHYEPFIVDSTHLFRSSRHCQTGEGSFNGQYTGDTENMSHMDSFESHHLDHAYHSNSSTSHSPQNISMPVGRISMGAPARSMLQTRTPDPYVIQSHGIYFGGYSDSTSSLPSETCSGYQGLQRQTPPNPPSYQASQYCRPPAWEDPSQFMHPPGVKFESGDRMYQPYMHCFSIPNDAHNPPTVPQHRPTVGCPRYAPVSRFNKENNPQTIESTSSQYQQCEKVSEAEGYSNRETEIRSVSSSLNSVQERQQGTQLCAGPIISREIYKPQHDFDGELEPVVTYILEAFRSGEYADCRLILNSAAENFPPMSFPLHSLVASRSPHLKELMKSMHDITCSREIHVKGAPSFSHPFALGMALQHFYGFPLLVEEQLDNDLTQAVDNSNGEHQDQCCKTRYGVEKMKFALCYVASAAFVAESKILRRAVRLATNAISWDTLEVIFQFGISFSDFMISPVSSLHVNREPTTSLPNGSERVAESDFMNGHNLHGCPYTLNWELKDVWAPRILDEAIGFIIEKFPRNFQLDPDAHSQELLDRLSSGRTPSRRYIREVSTLTFGSFADANSCKFRREERVMSAIFLAVPFKILRKLFNAMKVKGVLTVSMAEDIIFERERRRIRAVRTVKKKNEAASGSNFQLTIQATDPIGWREEILDIVGVPNSSPSIRKTWVGLDAPEVIEIKPKKERSPGAPGSVTFGA
ncbi:conserved hypothetical protein [Histoplasma capsulatum H143]|uniref:BTB domain-containing protein n=1 Tax=Ajellomyces capsulatus (strain H143) TaxID=544712 RepID=C6HHH7_AJECH|nr:conserved hypothetical protein [Histoplasma capsulatum H143]